MDNTIVGNIQQLVESRMIIKEGDVSYSPIKLHRIISESKIEKIKIGTLTGLVDYIKSKIDTIQSDKMFVVIDNHESVSLVSNIEDKAIKRDTIIVAELPEDGNNFPYSQFIRSDEFIIKLQSLFVDSNDRKRLLSYTSKLSVQDSVSLNDDGITQNAIVNKSASGALKETEMAPSIINLIPYRTFREIDQPESKFLFRLRSNGPNTVPSCALFEADGGAWKNQAIKNIKDYLKKELTDMVIIA